MLTRRGDLSTVKYNGYRDWFRYCPGQYTFQIGIEVTDKDYGRIPCRINVIIYKLNKVKEVFRNGAVNQNKNFSTHIKPH